MGVVAFLICFFIFDLGFFWSIVIALFAEAVFDDD